MSEHASIPVFDGHNDTLLSLLSTSRDFYTASELGHVDAPRAEAGNLVGGFFACFVPTPGDEWTPNLPAILENTRKYVLGEASLGPLYSTSLKNTSELGPYLTRSSPKKIEKMFITCTRLKNFDQKKKTSLQSGGWVGQGRA